VYEEAWTQKTKDYKVRKENRKEESTFTSQRNSENYSSNIA
jgi:hypothetical protein